MSEPEKCKRCGGQWPSNDNVAETTFWGLFGTKAVTTTERSVHFAAHYYRRKPRFSGSTSLVSDEDVKLCSDCWGLLIGRFMQGRDVPAMAGKGGR